MPDVPTPCSILAKMESTQRLLHIIRRRQRLCEKCGLANGHEAGFCFAPPSIAWTQFFQSDSSKRLKGKNKATARSSHGFRDKTWKNTATAKILWRRSTLFPQWSKHEPAPTTLLPMLFVGFSYSQALINKTHKPKRRSSVVICWNQCLKMKQTR